MKNRTLNTTMALAVILFTTVAFTTIKTEDKVVDPNKSKITWKGYKVTGSHEGTIALKEGHLEFDGTQLKGGWFTVDMTTIISTDLSGSYKEKLDNHLKSDDFFAVKQYPTANLKIKSAKSSGKNAYDIMGDLTIKGKTLPIRFDMSIYGSKAHATLKIDRSKYNVKYNSGSFFKNLGDKTIYDEFDLIVDLQF